MSSSWKVFDPPQREKSLHDQSQKDEEWDHLEHGMKLWKVGPSNGETSRGQVHAGHGNRADVMEIVGDGESNQQADESHSKVLSAKDH